VQAKNKGFYLYSWWVVGAPAQLAPRKNNGGKVMLRVYAKLLSSETLFLF